MLDHVKCFQFDQCSNKTDWKLCVDQPTEGKPIYPPVRDNPMPTSVKEKSKTTTAGEKRFDPQHQQKTWTLSHTRQPPLRSHSWVRAGSKPGWGESRVAVPTGRRIPQNPDTTCTAARLIPQITHNVCLTGITAHL